MPVYIAARDLAGLPIGTHQYIVIEITGNHFSTARQNGKTIHPRKLGPNKIGYVIGAQNRGNLQVEFFEKSDYQATLEHFDNSKRSWYKSDFDAELIAVKFPKKSEQEAIVKIYNMIDYYTINQELDRIKYPTGGLGFNSNSWAQTIIELAGGIKPSNLNGLDISHDKRIPKTYFDPVCPIKPRPKLN